MALFDEQEHEEQEPEGEKRADYTGVIILAALLPVFFFFNHIGKTDIGLNLCCCLGMSMLAVKIRWKLRKHLWFWAVIVFLLVLHIPLALKIQWPHEWVPGVALTPIGVADLAITLGAVRFVEKFIVKSPHSEDEA